MSLSWKRIILEGIACCMSCFSSNGAKSSSGSQPLVQWTEVHNHPGLLCCITQTSNTPIVMMVKPDAILVQEIKIQPAKAKVCLSRFVIQTGTVLFTKVTKDTQ